jgi:hypothetical protein
MIVPEIPVKTRGLVGMTTVGVSRCPASMQPVVRTILTVDPFKYIHLFYASLSTTAVKPFTAQITTGFIRAANKRGIVLGEIPA